MALAIASSPAAAGHARPCLSRRSVPSPGRLLPPRPRLATVCDASRLELALENVEARIEEWAAAAGLHAERTARRVQACLLGLILALRRLVQWFQLIAATLAVQPALQQQQQQQQQQAFTSASAGSGDNGSGSDASAAPPAPAASAPTAQDPSSSSNSGSNQPVIDFLSAATTGAVEQLRHTLMDASQGIESRMMVIERTASSVQTTLFQAARAHSEAVRSNPQVGMWKQPSVTAVISEEARLRDAVFAQVYAELLQKDTRSLSFNADAQP